MNKDDLKKYNPIWRKPLISNYRDTQIITGTVALVSTVLIGYALWSFYGRGRGSAAVGVVAEEA